MSKFGDEKKIYSFLRGLNDYEFILLGHNFDMARRIQKIIKQHEISKQEVCLKVGITKKQYHDFWSGAFNYDLKRIAKFEVLYQDKLKELAGKQEILEIKKSKKQ